MAPLFGKPILVNAIWFQLAWICAVVLHQPYLLMGLITFHIWMVREQRLKELVAVCACSMIGIATDQVLTVMGVYDFTSVFIPAWLALLWVCFASTLGFSMAFFQSHVWFASLFGAIGGGLSYLAGHKLGAVGFPLGVTNTILIVATVWALLFPLLLFIYSKVKD